MNTNGDFADDDIDVRSDLYSDDPNRAMGLSYRASVSSISETLKSASKDRPDKPGLPISRPLTAQEQQEKDEAEERYRELIAEDEKAEHEKLKAAGITDIAVVRGENTGAYHALRIHIQELLVAVIPGSESPMYPTGRCYSIAEATALALSEIPNVLHPTEQTAVRIGPRDRYFDACDCGECQDSSAITIMQLAFGKKGTGGGGGGGGRSRAGKSGTWTCKVCHLEFCEHRPVDANRSNKCTKCKRERKACECYEGRSDQVGARVSTKAKGILGQQSVSAGEIVETVVQAAVDAGMGPPGIQAILDELKDRVKQTPAA